jgi:hypothetical protein
MSTSLHDVASAALLGQAVTPRAITSTVTGSTLDLLPGDGSGFAIQSVGSVDGTAPTLAGKLRESADGSTWTDIGGATFTTVSASNNLQIIRFVRSLRYVRYEGTVAGTSPEFFLSVVVGQQYKQL